MKSEKGYTGVDIVISVIVLFIFVSIIATLSYSFNSSAKEIELKSKATEIAITQIETMKNITILDEGVTIKSKYRPENEDAMNQLAQAIRQA